MMKTLACTLMLVATGAHAAADPDALLRDFAADFENDAMAPAAVTFGVSMAEPARQWTVAVASQEDGRSVTVTPGMPETPTFYYTVDSPETLEKVHAGQWTGLTAMGKAFSTDVAPMDIEVMEGFQPDETFTQVLLPLTFHFWKRDTPEIVDFGDLANTRFVHGGHASLFYYQPGIRLGAGYILPGEHVNADERSRTNPFPTYVIMTEGEAIARIDGEDHPLRDGQAIFIGPGVSHEFLNHSDAPAQFVLVMFGEGA